MIVSGLCTAAKRDFLMGVHTPSDEYRIALYTARADLSPATTVYTAVGEVSGPGYVRGGQPLVGYRCGIDGGVAVMGWLEAPVWHNASLSASGALIYNASKGNRALVVVDFGQAVSSTNGDYRLLLPPPTAETALIRIL